MNVIVSTCDRYSAAWEPFCHGFRKYWPDCPWPLMFITNRLDSPGDKTIKVGTDIGWAETLRKGLRMSGSKHVLLMMEDHWLTYPVDSDVLMDFAEHVRRGYADHIRLYDSGQPREGDFHRDPRLFVFSKSARYRACLQSAFWDVEALFRLIRPGETAWQFEMRSAKRTRGSPKYLCAKYNRYFPYAIGPRWHQGIVVKGRWTRGAREYAEREGLEIDFSRHPGGER